MNKKNIFAFCLFLFGFVMAAPGISLAGSCGYGEKGWIVIDKVTDPAGDPQVFDFSITGVNGSANASIRDADAPAARQLRTGFYSVTEASVAGWQQVSVICVSDCGGTIDPKQIDLRGDEAVTCTFRNKKVQPGTITVKKITVGGDDTFAFTGDVSGSLSNGGTISIQVLPGTYSSTEAAKNGWDLAAIVCDDSDSSSDISARTATFKVAAGENVTCAFTNTKRGHIVVDKVTDPAGDPQSFDFVVAGSGYSNFSLTDGAPANDQELIPGAYSIDESAVAGWQFISAMCARPGIPSAFIYTPGSPLNLGAGETWNCVFTNKKQTGTLIVKKIVVNDDGGSKTVSDFAFKVNDAAPVAFESDGQNEMTVPAGTYNVTEPAVAGYATTYEGCDSVDIAAGETKTCTITNDDQPNSAVLTLVKKVDCGINIACGQNNCAKPSDFKLMAIDSEQNIDLQGMGAATGQVAPGTYVLEESGPDGYTAGNWVCAGGVQDGDLITLAAGQSVTCTITNTKDQTPPATRYGKLKVVKYTIGGDGKTEFTFTGDNGLGVFKLTPLNGKWMKMGKATKLFDNLAIGTKYTVTETMPDGWKQTANTCKNVKIKAGKTVTCIIVNVKKVEKPGCDKPNCCKKDRGKFPNGNDKNCSCDKFAFKK